MTNTAAPGTPPADVTINERLVRSLLSAQHPDLAALPIQIMEAGWDNVMVRIGPDLALRLPRRAAAQNLILNEIEWLEPLSKHLPLPIPVPIRYGQPQSDYPFHWTVQYWLAGSPADLCAPSSGEAERLAQFLKALHTLPLPDNPPANPGRDCPLQNKQADAEIRMASLRSKTSLITPAIEAIWKRALITKIDVPKCWIAGDIHARNVLVKDGKISAFIDWGDMCAGDPATDLASIWGLLSTRRARESAQDAYQMSPQTQLRAQGWAVFFGVILLDTGLKDTPRHAEMGRQILKRLDEDFVG